MRNDLSGVSFVIVIYEERTSLPAGAVLCASTGRASGRYAQKWRARLSLIDLRSPRLA